MFRLQLFGKFIAFEESGKEIRFESQSSGCIIALLFLRKGGSITRQELGEIIWPDSSPSQQRTNLRKAISRLPKNFELSGAIQISPEAVSLDNSLVSSELEVAEQAHRAYLQDRDSDLAPELLQKFWEVIRIPILDGWNQPWFAALRTRYSFWADEIGSELAELNEDRGEWETASRVWRQILEDNPTRIEAIKGLMRSESVLHGNDHAQSLVHQILPTLSDSLVTTELRKIFEAQKHLSAVVPQGELLRKRGPILLLVNLFEKNLQRGGEESLRLLASEVDSEFALQHPKVFLSLIDTSLTHSSGWSEDRKKLMSSALKFASRSCEFEVGHYWADEAIAHAPKDDIFVPSSMVMKAFLYFEEREYSKSEFWFNQAGSHPLMWEPHPTRSFYRAAFAGLLWQQARFDEAIEIYKEEQDFGSGLNSEAGSNIVSRALTNLAYIAGVRHQWDSCVELGEQAISIVGPKALNSMVLLAPLGSAKIQIGRTKEGVEDIKRGLDATAESGMKRYHQLAFDYASTSVAKLRGLEIAQLFVDANFEHRQALHHFRSPAEIELLNRSGLMDWRTGLSKEVRSEFSRQSPRSLNKFLVEALQ
jgi:DNA-binding SARP family transcriptional activator